MSTVVKENQILTSIPETARPQPVALEVSVTVNGARTIAGSDKREPFSESTKTVLIFGHGAVVRLTSSVAPGQLLFLTNEKTKKEVVCQVVKSKNYHNVSGYVELEFTEPVAGFWGMRFPASGAPQSSPHSTVAAPPVAAAKPASAPLLPPTEQKAPATSPATESRQATSSPAVYSPAVSTKVALPDAKFAAPTSPSTPAPDLTPPSVSSGQPPAQAQHNVRATASTPASVTASTASTASGIPENAKASKVVEIFRTKPAVASEHITSTKVPAASSKSILDSDEVKMPSWLEPLARNAAASSAAAEADAKEQLKHHHDGLEDPDLVITEISAVPESANAAVPVPSFGNRLLTDEFDTLSTNTGSSSKKGLIIGIAAGLLLLIGGGAWYMRQTAGGPPADLSTPVQNTVAENAGSLQTAQSPQVSAPSQVNASGTITTAAPVPATTGTTGASSANGSGGVSGSPSSLPEPVNASLKTRDVATNVGSAAPAPASRAKKPMLGEVNLSAPIVNSPAAAQATPEEGLNLEGSSQVPATAGLSSGVLGSRSKQPVAPTIPLPIGGDVKPARLISSVPPVYPEIARSQRLGGNVQIDALVDATGHITSMKIVSGPPLLQKSAMDALSHWKYEPAQLNGSPVATHLTVTIGFKLQ
jgi:TonB family protein